MFLIYDTMCNFCGGELENCYTPIKSNIGLEIYICKNCGLVQSKYDIEKYEQSNKTKQIKFKHLQCDAGYSEIRVGKQQMVNYAFECFDDIGIKLSPTSSVLDMKSARGDFALKVLDYFNLNKIDCIEEDDYMTVSYKDDSRLTIYRDKYHLIEKRNYDLIYSCHSLEHYQNPNKYLNFVRDLLKEDGLFYIDIPNIENIDNDYNIDEFFYDKHLYYYDYESIKSFISSIGFTPLYSKVTNQNIGLLFKRCNHKSIYPISNQYHSNKELIEKYSKSINENRNKLISVSNDVNKIFEKDDNHTNILIGCGRVLDAFVKYGGLDLDNFSILVDDYLYKITDEIYDKKLHDSSILDNVKVDNALVLIKHPSDKLLSKINFNDEKNLILLERLIR